MQGSKVSFIMLGEDRLANPYHAKKRGKLH
jgi:hypothetical protein